MRIALRRAIGVLTLAAWTAGCTSWRTEPVAPAEYITSHRPERVQLLMADSNVVMLEGARILRDSVVGDQAVGNTNRRVAVPVADVTAVRSGSLNIGKTLLAGAGIAGGVVLMVLLAGNSQTGGPIY